MKIYALPLGAALLLLSAGALHSRTGMLPPETITTPAASVSGGREITSILAGPQPAPAEGKRELAANSGMTVHKPGFTYAPLDEDVKERIYGLSYKEDCTVPYDELRYVSILYVDFQGETQTGEIICNKAIAEDLTEIFYELYAAEYPIERVRLVDEYDADDTLSITDNNTSCFNYRPVEGTANLSKHALGLAIDINPFYNPYVTYPGGKQRISPPGSEAYADRSADFPYKIDKDDLCYKLFTDRGFTWGGSWKTLKDYQHFQKNPK